MNPLLGGGQRGAVHRDADRGVFLLCHTSNPGARDLQELDAGGRPLFELIAAARGGWNTRGNLGLVVGATYPEELARVRAIAPEHVDPPARESARRAATWRRSLAAGLDPTGSRVLVNVSRAVCQAADPGPRRASSATGSTRSRRARAAAAAARRTAPGALDLRSPTRSPSACMPSARCASESSR